MVMPSGEFKLHVSAFPAHADSFILPRTNQFEIGAGVVIPTGILGRERGAGPLLRAGMQRRAPKSRIRLRLDGEVFRIAAAAVPTSPSSPQGALTSVGMVLNAIAAPQGVRVAPYGLAGIGVQYLRDATPDVYPGGFAGVRIGAGIRTRTGRVDIVAEVAAQAAVLASFGGVKSPRVGAYWPLTIGLRF